MEFQTTSNSSNGTNAGNFSIEVPVGYTLTVTGASKTGWYIVSLPDPVTEAVSDFRIVLGNAADVVGSVTVNGAGLAGVLINYTVDGEERSVTTDAAGNFVIRAVVGQEVVFVSVVKAGYSLAGELPDCIVLTSTTKDTPVEITMSADPVGPDPRDPDVPNGPDGPSDGSGGSSFALYLLVALVAVGAVLVVYFFFIRKP